MSSYKLFVRLFVAVVLCSLLLGFVDWKKTGYLLLDLTIIPTVFAFLLLCLGLVISALKWQLLMKALNIQVPISDLLRLYWTASFFQNFLPSSVGGDIVRLAVMRNSQRLADVAASIFVERLTGFITLLGLAFLALFARPQYFYLVDKDTIIWFALAGVSVAIILFLLYGRKITSYLSARIPDGYTLLCSILAKLEKLMVSIGFYRERKRAVITTFIVSLVFYATLVVFQYLTFASLGIDILFLEVIFIAPAIPLISLLPISLNGIGVAEGAFVILYTQLGVSLEEALAAALLRRILLLLFSLIGGIFVLLGNVSPTIKST